MDVDGPGCTRTAEVVAAFLDRAARPRGPDPEDGGPGAEHLRRCGVCSETMHRLRTDPGVGPDLELRLLGSFREWRGAGGAP